MNDEFGKVQSALSAISPDVDRETWVQLGMAVKATLGDGGFSAWDEWSQGGSSYQREAARATWRSIKAAGGIGPGTLFKLAADHGWRGEPIIYDAAKEAQRRAARAAEARRDEELRAKRRARAAGLAEALVKRSTIGEHAYLVKKGFPAERGLIAMVDAAGWEALGFRKVPAPEHPRQLVIPMRDVTTNAIVSVQLIDTKGGKQFIPGGQSRLAVCRLGRGPETWIVEGYATGLSVRAALAAMFRQATVLVTFSAANLRAVAQAVSGRRFVIADNDPPKQHANGTTSEGDGPKYARETGLPMWMPPDAGTDANDYHQSAGLRALCEAMRALMTQ